MLERATRDEREKDMVREAADPRQNRLRLLPHRTLSAIYHPLSSDSLGPTNLFMPYLQLFFVCRAVLKLGYLNFIAACVNILFIFLATL